MPITFVGSSKEARDRARYIAVDYLMSHPKENEVKVYRRKWNYSKEKDEVVIAGYVMRKNDGSFYWYPSDDRSSSTNINRYGESIDPIWWHQIRKSIDGKEIDTAKTLVEARAAAIRIMESENIRNLYISKAGYMTLGIVSKRKDRPGEYVWIEYRNPRKPVAFGDQHILKLDGKLGRRL